MAHRHGGTQAPEGAGLKCPNTKAPKKKKKACRVTAVLQSVPAATARYIASKKKRHKRAARPPGWAETNA